MSIKLMSCRDTIVNFMYQFYEVYELIIMIIFINE